MVMSRAVSGKSSGDDGKKGKLLQEIEDLNKGIFSEKNPSRGAGGANSIGKAKTPLLQPDLKSKPGDHGAQNKDKKSFWNWKALKVLSHVRNRRFNCCFTLQVHTIEGLPPDFNGLSLCVHWKRRDGEAMTSPVKVTKGVAEFEEGLTHTCSVYGSRSGPHHSAKYEAKHFLLYAAVYGDLELDLGKHRVDLTRLLPLTLEELEDEKNSGNWTTTFKLSGRARGAVMNVSFGYLVLGDSIAPAPNNKKILELLSSRQSNPSSTRSSGLKTSHGDGKGTIRRAGSLPSQRSLVTSRSTKDIQVLHEVFPVTKFEHSKSNSLKVLLDEKLGQELDAAIDKSEIDDALNQQAEDSFHHPKAWNPSSSPLSDSCVETLKNETEDSKYSLATKAAAESSPDHLELESTEKEAVEWASVERLDLGGHNMGVKQNISDDEDRESNDVRDDFLTHESKPDSTDICAKQVLLRELETALKDVADLENAALATPRAKSEPSDEEGSDLEFNSSWSDMPCSLVELAESVETEFLSMLELQDSPCGLSSEGEPEPESPRERLLREFENENSASCLFDFDTGEQDEEEYSYNAPRAPEWDGADFEIPPPADWDGENHMFGTLGDTFRPRAKVLEDLETEALMQEWGLDEKAFQKSSSPNSDTGFGSPIDLPLHDEPAQLPPLGEGLGPFIQTKNGGFLRSMNPTLFRNVKSEGSLIMQVSSPVVVPAKMGSGVTDILQHLASFGLEKLSMQANKLMPLEDITGKTMEQIAWEASLKLEGSERQNLPLLESEFTQPPSFGKRRVKGRSSRRSRLNKPPNPSLPQDDAGSEYVSLQDLAPLAMDKIEALSIEGLRMQSGLSEEQHSSSSSSRHGGVGQFPVHEATGSVGMEGAVGLQLLDLKAGNKGGGEDDGLMDLSISLDEWIRLDSGEVDEDQISERTSRVLAAHHAATSSTDLTCKGKGQGPGPGRRRCGLFGNNFTVALMVQLRDPLRNYESVGTPMLALIQVERVFVPPKPKIHSTVVAQVKAIDGEEEEEDDDDEVVPELVAKVEVEKIIQEEEEVVPQYKIAQVHLAGLKNEPGNNKNRLWGGKIQQQSGSRWLIANGMGKSNKHPLLKSRAITKSSLWSIS
ncbi:hypothetical protein Dimus_002731 [Dionaea muscipula]